MKKRNHPLYISVIIILIIAITIILINNTPLQEALCQTADNSQETKEPLVGGERDLHGCLGPAGYTYDQEIQACIRTWELDQSQKKATKIAVQHIKPYFSLTISQVVSTGCNGCFSLQLTDKDFKEIEIILDNWEVVEENKDKTPETFQITSLESKEDEIILTKDQCTNQQGKIRDSYMGCYSFEIRLGNIMNSEDVEVCCTNKQ